MQAGEVRDYTAVAYLFFSEGDVMVNNLGLLFLFLSTKESQGHGMPYPYKPGYCCNTKL